MSDPYRCLRCISVYTTYPFHAWPLSYSQLSISREPLFPSCHPLICACLISFSAIVPCFLGLFSTVSSGIIYFSFVTVLFSFLPPSETAIFISSFLSITLLHLCFFSCTAVSAARAFYWLVVMPQLWRCLILHFHITLLCRSTSTTLAYFSPSAYFLDVSSCSTTSAATLRPCCDYTQFTSIIRVSPELPCFAFSNYPLSSLCFRFFYIPVRAFRFNLFYSTIPRKYLKSFFPLKNSWSLNSIKL